MSELLEAFTEKEYFLANQLLCAKVATMLGRKMEEGDWDFVYCNSKRIPQSKWSNLNIDINFNGLGVEHKMLRVTKDGPIKRICGTTMMHPAGTRSIRIPNILDPNEAAKDILNQYNRLIEERAKGVREFGSTNVDMRTGWLLWKDSLDEFLYFEERMKIVNTSDYYAEWNINSPKGSRKGSKNLWIFEKTTGKKKYSITNEAGAKVQPYFDIPPPGSKYLNYFKVQGVMIGEDLIEVWLTKSTAKYLELLFGGLDIDTLSDAILKLSDKHIVIDSPPESSKDFINPNDIAIPIRVSQSAYRHLKNHVKYVSDEQMFQDFATQQKR